MDKTKSIIGVSALALTVIAGVALASNLTPKQAVEFYRGHSHEDGLTQGAPEHGGGLDANGCHNKSVPYHCHR